MKKKIAILLVMTFLLGGCGNNGQGTYYPDSEEMQNNLKSKDYQVSIENIQENDYSGTYLTATKDNEYIEFYWLDNESDADVLADELENDHDDYDKLVSAERDSKFGSFVFCATETATDDAGIIIVDVKID